MAISRRWKLISGTTGVAVALSAGAAVAADGGSNEDVVLDDVKEISDMVATTSTTFIESPEPVVILDDFEFENANSIIVGLQGSGKSMFLKYQMEQHVLQGTRVYAIDIEGAMRQIEGTALNMGIIVED